MATLILTDNPFALDLARELQQRYGDIEVFQSPGGGFPAVESLNVKTDHETIIQRFELVVSIHCKQIFPPALVSGVRCINVHPGLNPYNRGWFPQVFSIIDGQPAGVTIHEIDDHLDHGPIIVQTVYPLKPWDTSGSAYENLMKLERELVLKHFEWIRNTPPMRVPTVEGNVNLKRDFDRLRQIDLAEEGTFGMFLNRLRALTHGDFRNAYFLTPEGNRVNVRVILEPDAQAVAEYEPPDHSECESPAERLQFEP